MKAGRLGPAAPVFGLSLWAFLAGAADAGAADRKSLGFVITTFRSAIYETKYMEECPEGLAAANDQIWWENTPPKIRAEITLNGNMEPVRDGRHNIASTRGPNGEDVCWNPTVVKDPPHKIIEGTTSFGMNLDGSTEDSATPSTCAHGNFTNPEGVAGVDNQFYRLMGCVYGWRRHGFHEPTADIERTDTSQGIILIEIAGVDSLEADADVEVAFYRAVDLVAKDPTGKMLPHASYRIDDVRRYGAVSKGRLQDGVLTTEPVDAHLPYRTNNHQGELYIKGMRMELRPAAAGAVKGMMAGYYDLENFWDFMRKIAYLAVVEKFSCPALYVAAHELADGYPDPKTGQCTALSSAFTFEAIPAFIIHPNARSASAQ